MKWEYLNTLLYCQQLSDLSEELNKIGLEGWEVYGLINFGEKQMVHAKRQLREEVQGLMNVVYSSREHCIKCGIKKSAQAETPRECSHYTGDHEWVTSM